LTARAPVCENRCEGGTPMAEADADVAAPPAPRTQRAPDRVVIRPLSGVIFLYPTLIAALICGTIVAAGGADAKEPGSTGLVFTLTFFFNLSIVAFDYTRLTSIVLVLLGVILGLLSVMFHGVGHFIQSALNQPLFMNSTFYWVWSACLALIFGLVLMRTWFDYWEVRSNELLHHHGFLGDVERWPAPDMRISKEIKDVMEYALARSGRLVLIPKGETRAIVIDNVPRINKVENDIQTLLSALRVSAD
jgi:prepilin signal peptidase PulO-like enzyme (type II secretory pathway)